MALSMMECYVPCGRLDGCEVVVGEGWLVGLPDGRMGTFYKCRRRKGISTLHNGLSVGFMEHQVRSSCGPRAVHKPDTTNPLWLSGVRNVELSCDHSPRHFQLPTAFTAAVSVPAAAVHHLAHT
jgi:hypothetical protein